MVDHTVKLRNQNRDHRPMASSWLARPRLLFHGDRAPQSTHVRISAAYTASTGRTPRSAYWSCRALKSATVTASSNCRKTVNLTGAGSIQPLRFAPAAVANQGWRSGAPHARDARLRIRSSNEGQIPSKRLERIQTSSLDKVRQRRGGCHVSDQPGASHPLRLRVNVPVSCAGDKIADQVVADP
jgi:hypothetical protein